MARHPLEKLNGVRRGIKAGSIGLLGKTRGCVARHITFRGVARNESRPFYDNKGAGEELTGSAIRQTVL